MRGNVVAASELRISFLVIVLLLFSLVPFSSSSFHNANAAAPIVPTAISPTPEGAGGLHTLVTVPPSSAPTNLCSGNCVITGGTRPGGGTNLFHSFGQFNVGSGDITIFQNGISFDLNGTPLAAGLQTSNILARVTGNIRSDIFGTIRTTTDFGNANLFLMNPAGFLFGPNATVNVGGMVAFTSADYLRLNELNGSNAGIFHADPTQASIWTNAPVAAFGFLGSNPGAITVQGSQFTVTDGQSISLVGGNIAIQSGTLNNGTVQPARLSAHGGQINLASFASLGEVSASNFLPEPGMTMTRGNITLSQGTTVNVSGDAAGTIRIRAGKFELVNSALNADTGNAPGTETAIDIHLTGNLFISSDSVPAMTARSFGHGNAGEISATSANMETVSTLPEVVSLIDTHTEGAGNGGNVILDTGNLMVMGNPGGFDFFIMSGTAGAGNGGNVTVHADTAHLQGARIDTGDAILGGRGSGGDVTFTGRDMATGGDRTFDFVSIATDSLNARGGNLLFEGRDITITNESTIGSLSHLGESTLTITARNFALRNGSFLLNQTTLGTGGGTTLTVQNAEFTNGSRVASQTNGNGDSGFIKLFATGDVTFADTFNPNPINNVDPINPSGLFTNSLGDVKLGTRGNAGPIDATARFLTMTGGTRFDSSTRTNGDGGTITVTTTDGVSIAGERLFRVVGDQFGLGNSRATGIYTRTTGNKLCSGACGNAGGILVTTGDFQLAQGGTINVGTSSTGQGGAAAVIATKGISISGTMLDGTPSGISSRSIGTVPGSGEGGSIALMAGQSFTMSDGASVSASSTGPGNAGNISINAGQQFDMRNSSVKTEAAQASGGNIDIQAIDRVRLVNSSISTSVLGGSGSGGNITIDPNVVFLQNSKIIAQAVQGAGGNITITTPLFLADSSSLVSASSQFGLNGTVTIQSPTSNLSGSVGTLTTKPNQAQSLLTQRCAALANGQASSFVVAGREQLPPDPGGWLSGPIALAGIDAERSGDGAVAEGTSNFEPRTSGLLTSDRVSLRRLTPAGFLIANFADSEATGCHS